MDRPFTAIPEDERPAPLLRRVRQERKQRKSRIQRTKEMISELAPGTLQHTLFFGGLLCGSYGFWLMYHPAGFIVFGAIAVWVSFLLASEQNESGS